MFSWSVNGFEAVTTGEPLETSSRKTAPGERASSLTYSVFGSAGEVPKSGE